MRRKMKIILTSVALVGVLAAGVFGYNQLFNSNLGLKTTSSNGINSTSPTDPGLSKRVSVLLIGADQRPGETAYNTDSLILANIDPDTKRISLLSIPRDTRVELQGHGYVKINAIAALTDLPTLQKSVEDLTGVTIAGYVQTNFDGFKKIIDTLGGVTVDVEKDMYYVTGDTQDGVINLKKGVQRLDGTKALEYARFRHDALADISRTARQQVVLKAVAKEMFQLSTLPKLPFLIPQFMAAVHTNLSAGDIFTLGKVAIGFDSANVISQTLPGSFLDLDGISYWQVDPQAVKTVVANLLLGETTDKVIGEDSVDLLKPIVTPPPKTTPSKPTTTTPATTTPATTTPATTTPVVPGGTQDPNGQNSTGFEIYEPKS